MSQPASRPLRVALLIEHLHLPAWQAELVRAIAADPGLSLVIAMVVNPCDRARGHALALCGLRFLADLPVKFATKADSLRIRRGRLPDPWRLVPVGGDLPCVAAATVTEGDRPGSRRLAETAVMRLRAAEPDVILTLAGGRWDGAVLDAALLGVWELAVHRRSGVESYARRQPTVGVNLWRRRADGSRALIRRATVFVDPLSIARTNWHMAWNAGLLTLAALRSAADGPPYPNGEVAELDDEAVPGTLAGIATAVRLPLEMMAELLGRHFRPQEWEVRLQPAEGHLDAAGRPHLNAAKLRAVPQPAGHSYADPMLVEHRGKRWLMIEDLCLPERKGRIAAIELDGEGRALGPATPALERPYHLSYPFVFGWGGELWMIPETSAARTLELYRAVDGPREWVLDRVLMEDKTVLDATLIEHGDRWWMFATVDPNGVGSHGALHLFSAETPLGPWRPHRHNPVVLDVRCARPAGPLFRHGDRLYRPAQDCSYRYGYAVRLMEVLRLDDEGYIERPAGRVAPDLIAGGRALHTWGQSGGLAAIDVQRRPDRLGRLGMVAAGRP